MSADGFGTASSMDSGGDSDIGRKFARAAVQLCQQVNPGISEEEAREKVAAHATRSASSSPGYSINVFD